jgi:hypothetical protein
MKLSTHVLSALDNWDLNKKDFLLMDACFAIEGTARNLYKKESANRNDYKKCLREYYWIIEIVSGLGINLKETKFNNLKIKDWWGREDDVRTILLDSTPNPIVVKLEGLDKY